MVTSTTIYTERRNPNPLAERLPRELKEDVRMFHRRHMLEAVVDVETLVKGALLAQDAARIETDEYSLLEKTAVRSEINAGFLNQTRELKISIVATACAASMQGWQQSSINVGLRGWQCSLLLDSQDANTPVSTYQMYITSLIDAAPWLSASILWVWTALSTNWWTLLACRLILGIGIGAKASVGPVFAAEVAPDRLRGQMVVIWQLSDTLGMLLGFAFYWIARASWTVLLGSAAVPALILLVLVFLCPESPRFLIRRGDYRGAFTNLRRCRQLDIQAARDLYYIHTQLQVETALLENRQPEQWWQNDSYQELFKLLGFWGKLGTLFAIPRSRRACIAAFIVMATQQLCGINVLSFHSSSLFRSMFFGTGPSNPSTENDSSVAYRVNCQNPMEDRVAWLNFGFGLASFIFAIPAYSFINRRGHRFLLLVSLGGMFFTLLATGGFLRITSDNQARQGLASITTIILITFFYGIGAGPVPYTFCAEVFPLPLREIGMSFSTMVNLLGLGLLVLFVPPLTTTFLPDGPNAQISQLYGQSNLFFLFAGLDALAFELVYFLVPSGTARASLEEMNHIFNTKTSVHVAGRLPGFVRRKWHSPSEEDHEEEDGGIALETVLGI
ncbi:hypothetical protein BJY01DRAFT_236277 [Aspergillus pseudoustus]|uniref:Major facilitator superfamily (MFS) profile domain-containing protein n=1 Tax=Aspergillus pseudoustus TaxID=1810923 RepID=A0ABR4JPP9_9EURO